MSEERSEVRGQGSDTHAIGLEAAFGILLIALATAIVIFAAGAFRLFTHNAKRAATEEGRAGSPLHAAAPRGWIMTTDEVTGWITASYPNVPYRLRLYDMPDSYRIESSLAPIVTGTNGKWLVEFFKLAETTIPTSDLRPLTSSHE